MLTALFFFQPFGQLVAVLVAFAATAGFRSHIASITTNSGFKSCSITANNVDGMSCARDVDRAWRLVAGLGGVPAIVAVYFRFTIPESVYYTLDVMDDSRKAMGAKRYYDERDTSGAAETDDDSFGPETEPESEPEEVSHDQPNGNLPGTEHDSPANGHQIAEPAPQSQSQPIVLPKMEDGLRKWFSLFREYLSRGNNWKDLLATSLNWMSLDFTFFLLGVNSSTFVPTLFGETNGPYRPPYSLLIDEERHIMESSSIGWLMGSIAAIVVVVFRDPKPFGVYYNTQKLVRYIDSPRKLQMWGFAALAPLFIIVGALYINLPTTHAYVAIVIFYQLCNFFFNLGWLILKDNYKCLITESRD